MTCRAITGARLPPALLPPIVTTPSVTQVAMTYSIMLLPLSSCTNCTAATMKYVQLYYFEMMILQALLQLCHTVVPTIRSCNACLLSMCFRWCMHLQLGTMTLAVKLKSSTTAATTTSTTADSTGSDSDRVRCYSFC
jgi:hypothetical protein